MSPNGFAGRSSGHPDGLLVTCGGRWVPMLYQLRDAMARTPPLARGRLCVADAAPVSPAGCFADAAFRVPRIGDPSYVPALVELCRTEGVRVLLPLIDLDQARLAPHAEAFRQVGTSLVCPTPSLMDLCFDKAQFDAFAQTHGLQVPRSFAPADLEAAPYPLFFKPRLGFGSRGSGIAANPQEARKALAQDPDLVFQEFVEGPEICVDAFLSRNGAVLHAVQRVRDKVIGGESVSSHTIRKAPIHQETTRLLEALATAGYAGPCNLQYFDASPPLLFDVNLRLGLGGSTLSNAATRGALFAAVLQEACGLQAPPPDAPYEEGLWMHKFLGDLFTSEAGGIRGIHPGPDLAPPGCHERARNPT